MAWSGDKKPKRKWRVTGYRKWEKEAVRKSGTVSIGESLDHLIDHLNIGDILSQQKALTVWHSVVGSAIAAKSEPRTIKDGIMTISVPDSTWKQELSYLKDDIIKKLNRKLGEEIVREIRIR